MSESPAGLVRKMEIKKGITAHCIVRNEENWVWYAINSVIAHVDEIFVYDTGSEDNTIAVIKTINSPKLTYKAFQNVSGETITDLYQDMLNKTHTSWMLVLDGDEIWFEDSIKSVRELILKDGQKWFGIVTPFYTLMGDIYHYQEEAAGRYQIGPYKGHITIRAMNKDAIPGFQVGGIYRSLGYFDGNGIPIQKLDYRKFYRLDKPFFHTTHLPRSPKDETITYPERRKRKYELGIEFPYDFYYPEVFFRHRPDIVPPPWGKMARGYILQAAVQTPVKKLKRRLVSLKLNP